MGSEEVPCWESLEDILLSQLERASVARPLQNVKLLFLALIRKLNEQQGEKERGGCVDCSSGQHGRTEMKYLDRLTEELAGSVLAVI